MSELMIPDESNKHQYHSELFTIRLWREHLDDHSEWRGKVIHNGSREERYFRKWESLIAFMKEMLLGKNTTTEEFNKEP